MGARRANPITAFWTSRGGPGLSVPPTPMFVLPFLLGWVAHVLWPAQVRWSSDWIGAAFGLPMIIAAAALFTWAMWTFKSAKTGIMLQNPATAVVTDGPYRWSRNPMYVAFVLAYAGAALLLGSWWPWLLLPLAIAALRRLVVAREERYMAAHFPAQYRSYCERIPRWFNVAPHQPSSASDLESRTGAL